MLLQRARTVYWKKWAAKHEYEELKEGVWLARTKTMRQEREEVCAALQYAASFHCVVKEWKDCEELKPKPKEKLVFEHPKKRRRNIERSGARKPTSIGA